MNTNNTHKTLDESEGTPTMPFGIRCERDGTGRLSPAAAWFKELGVVQRYATLQAAEHVARSLNNGALPCCRYVARAFAEGLGEPPPTPAPIVPAGPDVTSAEFVQWCRDHKGLAEAVCHAKAFAQAERERVYAYIMPVFESFGFLSTETGNKIKDPDQLYLCENDEARVQEFYTKADEAHRAHGFTGEAGVWPNLEAETLQTYAENALLDAACKFFGMKGHPIGKKREQFLKLTLSACLNVPASAAGSKQS